MHKIFKNSTTAALLILLAVGLTACGDSTPLMGKTPAHEYVSKMITSGENALKGIPGGGAEFDRLTFDVRYSLQGLRHRSSLYSQSNQYYINEINKLDMYDEKITYRVDSQRNPDRDARSDVYYQEYLKQHQTHIFHPTQLRAGKVHTVADKAWAFEGMSQGGKIFLVFTQNSELGIKAVIIAPTLDLAKQDYTKWQTWWESAGKQEYLQRIEQEKKNKEEQDKRAEYEKQKPERDAAVASVQQDMLSLLEFSDVKYEAIEDRGGFALVLKFKVKQSTERPVSSMECDVVIKNKDNKIVEIIRIEDRHRINFEPNKLYLHEIGVKPQSAYRQNLVRKIASNGYSAEIRPVQFYNGERFPLSAYEIEKNLARNADGTYSYKGSPVAPLAQSAAITEEALQANIQAETMLQESEAKIFEAQQTELAQKYLRQVSVSFVSLTKKRADPSSILVFSVQNNSGLPLEEVKASFEVLEGGAIVKSDLFSVDITKKDSSSPQFEKAVHFFDGEPLVLGFQNGSYTMHFEVKAVTLNGVTYAR